MDLYRFFNNKDRLLYVGISLSAAQRAAEHRSSKPWWPEVARMEVEHLKCERDGALAIERSAIEREKPLYNVTHNKSADEFGTETLTSETDGLVGHYILTPDPDHGFPLMQCQGYIHEGVGQEHYLISWFSWWSGDETERRIVPMSEMLTWNLYETKEDFDVAVKKGWRARDEQTREREVATERYRERLIEARKAGIDPATVTWDGLLPDKQEVSQ